MENRWLDQLELTADSYCRRKKPLLALPLPCLEFDIGGVCVSERTTIMKHLFHSCRKCRLFHAFSVWCPFVIVYVTNAKPITELTGNLCIRLGQTPFWGAILTKPK